MISQCCVCTQCLLCLPAPLATQLLLWKLKCTVSLLAPLGCATYDRLQGPAYCSKLNSTKVLLSFHEGHPIFNGAIHTCIKKFEARLLLSSHFSFVPCFALDEN